MNRYQIIAACANGRWQQYGQAPELDLEIMDRDESNQVAAQEQVLRDDSAEAVCYAVTCSETRRIQ